MDKQLFTKAVNSLGVVFFPAFDWAISPTHPEREERLLYTRDQLKEEGIFDIEGITEYRPEFCSYADIERVHFCLPSIQAVTTDSHLASAGGAITAARLVLENREQKAFALVRPPGHHSMRVVHGNRGFCNINNEAVMIAWIRDHYAHPDGRPLRIAIVDTDVHHADGSQDIFWNDPDTLFISFHQDGRTLYPGTGFLSENGGLNSGFMITQYSAASMVSENKVWAHPASVDSIPSSANQEDHVSMGTIAARKARMILDNAQKVIGIELFAASQALYLRGDDKLAPATKAVYNKIRESVAPIHDDIVMYEQMNKFDAMVKAEEIVRAAESVCGILE